MQFVDAPPAKVEAQQPSSLSWSASETLSLPPKRRGRVAYVSECEECGAAIREKPSKRRRFCSRTCSNRAGAAHRGSGFGKVLPIGTLRPNGKYLDIKCADGKWRGLHREVMSAVLNRPLLPGEQVHHIDGNTYNNYPTNLELWLSTRNQPPGVRAADYHCPGCRCAE